MLQKLRYFKVQDNCLHPTQMTWKTFVIQTLKPSNNELRSVIETILMGNFKSVHVAVATSPDLTKPPFRMSSNGFGKNLSIAEVGGMGNLFPRLHKEKEYDIKEICELCDKKSAFVFGPGACPKSVLGTTGELVADVNLTLNKVASKATSLVNNHSSPYKTCEINSPKFNLMANLAISEQPEPAEVLHIKCSERTGNENFPRCIQKGLAKHYGQCCVSLAGVFIMNANASVHIVPDFPSGDFSSREEINKWFYTFTVKGPLVGATVLHSYDPGHNLRMEHTHCYSDHDDAGHYYNDVSPKTVTYEGWFAAAERIYRIDEI
ncbi:hypothetical protein Q1695_003962 [Nippostrongylus brasiliensis]|nr:hypothetical protein Q1695_003962 [Nippostrongylus brasiliensis]